VPALVTKGLPKPGHIAVQIAQFGAYPRRTDINDVGVPIGGYVCGWPRRLDHAP
jgi:hypothetical protein